ncbi:helix-turn-helix transcriptional regulator [Paenibacillus sinopodophylli]|uniref:helix-turn-helix transcriptional regulator n=1 Tax=Paenibacillus sinopodophylli TaxID=1837342 RepID=UPI00110CB0FD|nr:AraC family transcriptional regulator [Paenibacillus sinopodophylli]
MESQYDELAAFFLQVPIDVFGVHQTLLQAGIYQGHKYQPTAKCGLVIALKGEAIFSYDGESYPMYPGKTLLGGFNRSLELEVQTPEFEYFLVHYLPAHLDQVNLAFIKKVNELHIELDAALLQLMGQLRGLSLIVGNIELLEKKTLFYRLLNKALLFERYQQNSESQPMMEQTIAYIRKHYMDTITLESLAEQHQMKAKYFSHLFRKYTGIGPINYLIQYRMNLAHVLLTTADFSIREIASSVGYSDAYYFSRLFKKHYGMSPSAVRLQEV